MNKLTQKEAVYGIISSILIENNITLQEHQLVNEVITKDMRRTATACLIEGFNCNEIQMDKKMNEKELRAYSQSVISNWIRKDTRLNGGKKYEPNKKGSRVGYNDPEVKAMRQLLKECKRVGKLEHVSAIESEINKRLQDIRKTKLNEKLDISAIPEHLRHLV